MLTFTDSSFCSTNGELPPSKKRLRSRSNYTRVCQNETICFLGTPSTAALLRVGWRLEGFNKKEVRTVSSIHPLTLYASPQGHSP